MIWEALVWPVGTIILTILLWLVINEHEEEDALDDLYDDLRQEYEQVCKDRAAVKEQDE